MSRLEEIRKAHKSSGLCYHDEAWLIASFDQAVGIVEEVPCLCRLSVVQSEDIRCPRCTWLARVKGEEDGQATDDTKAS